MSHNDHEPMPQRPGGGRSIWDMVIEDMRERDNFGAAKYGGPLVANDGRRSLVDAYQEALDLAVYLKKAIVEKPKITPATLYVKKTYLISHQTLGAIWADFRYWLVHPCGTCRHSIWYSRDWIHDRCAQKLARELLKVIDLNGTPTVLPDGHNS